MSLFHLLTEIARPAVVGFSSDNIASDFVNLYSLSHLTNVCCRPIKVRGILREDVVNIDK